MSQSEARAAVVEKFVADRLTLALVAELDAAHPSVNWGAHYRPFLEYVRKGREAELSAVSREWGDALVDVLSRLKSCRERYRNGDYFKMREWDRVLVTTLFTFYADIMVETIRFVQLVLNSTMGKVGRGKTFFFKAFGESTAAFREMLLMPEYMIRFRLDCEASGVTERWHEAFLSLDAGDARKFRDHLAYNDFLARDEGSESKALRRFLSFYRDPPEIKEISDTRRKRMVAEFDERLRDVSARLTEADLAREREESKRWQYSF